MTRRLQKVGNSQGIVLTRVMLEHLGVTDEVEVVLEQGQIRITAPQAKAAPHAARVLRRRRKQPTLNTTL